MIPGVQKRNALTKAIKEYRELFKSDDCIDKLAKRRLEGENCCDLTRVELAMNLLTNPKPSVFSLRDGRLGLQAREAFQVVLKSLAEISPFNRILHSTINKVEVGLPGVHYSFIVCLPYLTDCYDDLQRMYYNGMEKCEVSGAVVPYISKVFITNSYDCIADAVEILGMICEGNCDESRCGEKAVHYCSGCAGPAYCSKKCQRGDWKRKHKNSCALMKKARESNEEVC